MKTEVIVVEHGLQTIDAKPILPGSILLVPGELVPQGWTGLVERRDSVSEKQLVVATPDTEALQKQIADLESAKQELVTANADLTKQLDDADNLIADLKKQHKK